MFALLIPNSGTICETYFLYPLCDFAVKVLQMAKKHLKRTPVCLIDDFFTDSVTLRVFYKII